MTDTASESAVIIFFIANAFYCSAYIVKDILWLRILTITAALLTMPYFLFQSSTMYSALFWQAAFVLINAVHVCLLLHERRPAPMTDDQQLLHQMVFRNFTTRETRNLLDIANVHNGVPNEVLINIGQTEPVLHLLQQGHVEIIQNNQVVAWSGPGSFLGELHFMTGRPAVADVVFSSDSLYITWEAASLRQLLHRKPAMKTAFEALLTANIASKLGERGQKVETLNQRQTPGQPAG